MSETVEFPSNGGTASGYFVKPKSGSGPGVLVIQEWWGLDSGIKEMTDRLGAAGFVALAPDLYHGELAGHTEMDKAGKLMQEHAAGPGPGAGHERRCGFSIEESGGDQQGHWRGGVLHGRDAGVFDCGESAGQGAGGGAALRGFPQG